MNQKFIIVYIISFCLFSCQDKRPKYYYLSYNNTITDVVVKGELKDRLESGDWAFYNQDKVLLSKGRYNNGLKEGTWLFLVDNINVNLNWSTSLNNTSRFFINYPSEWVVVNDKEFLFRATFNGVDTLKGKYFLASKITNDSISIKPREYSKQFVSTVSKHFTVNSLTRLVIKNDGREVYFNKVDFTRDNKNLVIYEACVEINQSTYELIYSTDDLTNLSGVIFFNVLEGCFINSIRIVNPLHPYAFEKLANE